jgi:hypothetical protein
MQHLRASQRENYEEETFAELTQRLSDHAQKVLERVRASSKEPPQDFKADSTSVIETRFFKTLTGQSSSYELRDEGLALSYALVDQLLQAQRSGVNIGEQMTYLIDPIYAMDRTVDVMFAALTVCALDPLRFDRDIFTALLDAFSNLQNIDDRRFEEFVEIAKAMPKEILSTLRKITIERGRCLNQDWFIHAVFEIASTDTGWPVTKCAIHQWLHCYNRDAIEQTNRHSSQNEHEQAKRLQETQNKVQGQLSSLSPFEKDLLARMTEIVGDTDSLLTHALKLLSGRDLAEFADSFIALGLALSLDRDTWSARKAFQQLTTFNTNDREAVKEAFTKAIEPLQTPGTSEGGQWTVVRMLIATDDEADAAEANKIAERLRENWQFPDERSPDTWRQCHVADPEALRPVNMEEGLETFRTTDPNKLMQSMGQSAEDHNYKAFLPVACRFQHEAAVEKSRNILSELITRVGTPLRQLIFNGEEYAPLMTRDMSTDLIARITCTDMVQTLPEREHEVLKMFLFKYLAPQLTPEEQLECLADSSFGAGYLFGVINSLKPQPPEVILRTLKASMEANDEQAAYGVLVAARYGCTPIGPEMESIVQKCSISEGSMLRALSFDLAIRCNLKSLRENHVHSNWSAPTADEKTYEKWFGSMLLIEAYTKKEIYFREMLSRIDPETWFAAIACVDDEIAKVFSEQFLHRLKSAIGEASFLTPPPVDITLTTAFPAPIPFLIPDEVDRDNGRFPRQGEFRDIVGTTEDFDEKQDRLHAISNTFFGELNKTSAGLFFERVAIEDLRSIVRLDPMALPQMIDILEQTGSNVFRWIKNFAFVVANIATEGMPERGAALFQRALASQGFVTYALGDDLTLEHQALWSSTPSALISSIWRQRLLESPNDDVLAREVLAAERFGPKTFIKDFVQEAADSGSTLVRAFAITVGGFSSQSEQFLGLIEDHLDNRGMTGNAAKYALKAHLAAQGAAKWVKDMWLAQSPEEFWRYLVISKTCMDARVASGKIPGTNWAQYEALFSDVRKAAIKKQNENRSKTLVGQEKPDEIFVTGY